MARTHPIRRRPATLGGPLDLLLLAGLAFAGYGCKGRESAPEGALPPPSPSSSAGAGVCRDGGGRSSDPVTAATFPRQVGGYCLDPNGETRAYGAEAKQPLDEVCLEQFDGECEVYKSFGLDRVVTQRYVDGGGSPGEVSVVLARFATREGAYGFYSRRVVGSDDPQRLTTRPLEAGGAGALGTGEAYVWRGLHVAQITYANTDEGRDAFARSSERALPGLARALGERIPGDREPPRAVALLPVEQRVPNGASYVFDDVLGVKGVGGGALGYYADGQRRYRIAVIVRPDVDGAGDVIETFGRLPGAEKEELLPFPARAFTLRSGEGAPKARWWVAQAGAVVVAVGDEELVLGPTAKESEGRTLSRAELVARLRAVVEQVRRSASAGEAPAPSGAASSAAPAGSGAPLLPRAAPAASVP